MRVGDDVSDFRDCEMCGETNEGFEYLIAEFHDLRLTEVTPDGFANTLGKTVFDVECLSAGPGLVTENHLPGKAFGNLSGVRDGVEVVAHQFSQRPYVVLLVRFGTIGAVNVQEVPQVRDSGLHLRSGSLPVHVQDEEHVAAKLDALDRPDRVVTVHDVAVFGDHDSGGREACSLSGCWRTGQAPAGRGRPFLRPSQSLDHRLTWQVANLDAMVSFCETCGDVVPLVSVRESPAGDLGSL